MTASLSLRKIIKLSKYTIENQKFLPATAASVLIPECPRANFFIVTADHEIVTSGKDILKGVVRKQLL